MKWTDSQLDAILARPCDIVVSAAAGSGKTQVLSTRITERIKENENPLSVDRLLVVTFTRAAASEMRERIGKSIKKAASEEQNADKRKYLARQLTLLGSAQMCTIDSFCYDVVRKNFFKANLPSDISIGETEELSLILSDALKETVDAAWCALEKKNGNKLSEENLELAESIEPFFESETELFTYLDGFEKLAQACSSDKNDSDFTGQSRGSDYTNMITSLYDKAQSAPYPDKWLDEICDMYSGKISYQDTFFGEFALSQCLEVIESSIASLREALECSAANNIGYEAYIASEILKLEKLSACKSYDELRKEFLGTELFGRISGKKRNCDALIASDIKSVIDSAKDAVKSAFSSIEEFSLEDCEALRACLYPQIKALCISSKILGKKYYEKMTDRKILDFSACEHLALNIISPDGTTLSEEGEAIKKNYDEIYIDEFQDSNALQDTLFTLISGGHTFTVGDVKQSIYGFRNADPSILMKKCDNSSLDKNAQMRKILLSANFRSRKCIIDAVNSVFDSIMTQNATGLDYKKDQRLDFGAEFIPGRENEAKCEITLIQKDGNSLACRENEARYVAGKIHELIRSGATVWDKESNLMRRVRYSDIVVLMRNGNAHGDVYQRIFQSELIPVYFDGGETIFDTSEVGQVIEILKLIDNSMCDTSLAAALRSPMFMFDENDLLLVRSVSNESFYNSFYGICSGKYKADNYLKEKCDKFMKCLTSWRSSAGFISIEELIRRIYIDTNIYTSALSFPDGSMRRANLDMLLDKAAEFERSSYSGLFNFVNYVERVKNTQGGATAAKPVSEKTDVVRIMSIHKSKGLEFPVVFLCESADKFKFDKKNAGGLVIDSKAIAMDVIDPAKRCKYASPMRSILEKAHQNSTVSEEMRILYVALTRARERLFVVGTVKNEDEFDVSQYRCLTKLSVNEVYSLTSYLKMIAVGYGHGGENYWNVSYIAEQEKDETESEEKIYNPAFLPNEETEKILSYIYPHLYATTLPGKASVTYLKTLDIDLSTDSYGQIHAINNVSAENATFQKPRFLSGGKGAFFGTAHHKLLSHICFDQTPVKEQRLKLLESGILTKEESDLIVDEKIEAFLNSPLADQIKKAQHIYREEPFVIFISPDDVIEGLGKEEKICVQGVIDFFFEKDEKSVVLIDFKTDFYTNPNDIALRYSKQLHYYEKALRLKFPDKKIEKYLYLLHNDDIIEIG